MAVRLIGNKARAAVEFFGAKWHGGKRQHFDEAAKLGALR
jgi:hypothetical protein